MKTTKINKKYTILISKIKSIKIQGAENIAKAGIQAYLLNPTKESQKEILSLRSTEPLLQNSIKTISLSKNKEKIATTILNEIRDSHNHISKHAFKLIKDDMKIYTHCHSSTVIDILKYAKKHKKNFTVYTTEVEPLRQGRMTARELSKLGINVIIGPDLAAEELLKQCDLFLFGADAFTKTAVYNKIGTHTLCKIAKNYNVPRFSCGISLKITNKVKTEQRKGKEVWDERNKRIRPVYPAFDKTSYTLLTGIISEFGIKKPKEFTKLTKQK